MKVLSDSLLQDLSKRLVKQFQPEKIIIFGSQVWGNPTEESDLDLVVIINQSNLSEYERSVLAHRCLNGLGVAKDVIVKTKEDFDFFRNIRGSLEYKIAQEGYILYERCQDSTCSELAHQGEE